MIARRMFCINCAVQGSQTIIKKWCPGYFSVKRETKKTIMFECQVNRGFSGKIIGNMPLLLPENTYTKIPRLANQFINSSTNINTNQNKGRIKRNRSERIGSHPSPIFSHCCCTNRHSCTKTSQDLSEARDQILKFPHDAHDDFVDTLAYIGLGLGQQTKFNPKPRMGAPKTGTFGELLANRRADELRVRFSGTGGF